MKLVYSYNPGSEGAKALAQALGVKRIKHNSTTFRGAANKTIINWGSTEVPREVARCTIINPPERIASATNKLAFLRLCKEAGVRVPEFSTDANDAKKWIEKGSPAVCRTILNGSGGRGIVLADDRDDVVRAPLYTRYVKKQKEYRVHCVKRTGIWPGMLEDPVFDVQQKAKKHDADNENFRIQNLENGFIYKREGIQVPDDVKAQAVKAFRATGLDFGAVDVVWNAHQDKAYVLEINTAPGLEGQTLQSYANIFS